MISAEVTLECDSIVGVDVFPVLAHVFDYVSEPSFQRLHGFNRVADDIVGQPVINYSEMVHVNGESSLLISKHILYLFNVAFILK